MVERFRTYWADTIGHTEEYIIRTNIIDILNLPSHLDLECSNPIFFHRTLRLMVLYYQTKVGCKRTSILEDTTEIVIFWLYKPSLWPWHWTQWTNFSDLERSNPFFYRILWLMMYYQTKFGCKLTRSLEDIVKIVMFLLYKPSLWPWHWRVKHGPPYQVWYKRMVQRFRRYWADTIGHTDRTTDGQTSGRTDGQNTVGGG